MKKPTIEQRPIIEIPDDLPDISNFEKPILMMVNFRFTSAEILDDFFLALRSLLKNKPYKHTSIVIFRHNMKTDRPDNLFFAIVFDPPKKVKRKTMVSRCLDAWDYWGGGELANFIRLEGSGRWHKQFEASLHELRRPDCVLWLDALIT